MLSSYCNVIAKDLQVIRCQKQFCPKSSIYLYADFVCPYGGDVAVLYIFLNKFGHDCTPSN